MPTGAPLHPQDELTLEGDAPAVDHLSGIMKFTGETPHLLDVAEPGDHRDAPHLDVLHLDVLHTDVLHPDVLHLDVLQQDVLHLDVIRLWPEDYQIKTYRLR